MSSWMITSSGREFFLDGIHSHRNNIDLGDIAAALAKINRFTGHTSRPYSVAEHSLLCADIAEHLNLPAYAQLAALMHDAHEAYVGDMTSPAKQVVGHSWHEFEDTIATQVRRHFGLLVAFGAHRRAIRSIDLMALATERRDLTAYRTDSCAPWPIIDTPGNVAPPADWLSLNTRRREQTAWIEWGALFVERFQALQAKVEALGFNAASKEA